MVSQVDDLVKSIYRTRMTPRKLGDGVWVLEAPLRVGPLELGARTTVLELAGGDLCVHSPGPPGPAGEALASVRGLGHVRALVAPNLMHHLFFARWASAFPEAACLGPSGVAAKVPGVRIRAIDAEWADLVRDSLDVCPLGGMPRLDEVALLHRPSRSLVLTDLCFNIRRAPLVTRLMMQLNQGFGRFGCTRLGRSLIQDSAALRRSLDVVLGWDFDRVIVGHGDVVESGGHDVLTDAFAWLR